MSETPVSNCDSALKYYGSMLFDERHFSTFEVLKKTGAALTNICSDLCLLTFFCTFFSERLGRCTGRMKADGIDVLCDGYAQ